MRERLLASSLEVQGLAEVKKLMDEYRHHIIQLMDEYS
jgi:hypothetical protein